MKAKVGELFIFSSTDSKQRLFSICYNISTDLPACVYVIYNIFMVMQNAISNDIADNFHTDIRTGHCYGGMFA